MSNSKLSEKLAALMEDFDFSNAVAATESSEDVVKLLSSYGIEVTEAELNEVLNNVPIGQNDELDEVVLENVSGGGVVSSLWARLHAGLTGGHSSGGGRHG